MKTKEQVKEVAKEAFPEYQREAWDIEQEYYQRTGEIPDRHVVIEMDMEPFIKGYEAGYFKCLEDMKNEPLKFYSFERVKDDCGPTRIARIDSMKSNKESLRSIYEAGRLSMLKDGREKDRVHNLEISKCAEYEIALKREIERLNNLVNQYQSLSGCYIDENSASGPSKSYKELEEENEEMKRFIRHHQGNASIHIKTIRELKSKYNQAVEDITKLNEKIKFMNETKI